MMKVVAAVIFLTVNVGMVSTSAAAASSMSTLIEKVNEERAALNKGGYSMITQLTVSASDVASVATEVGCPNLGGSSVVNAGTLSAKAFYSDFAVSIPGPNPTTQQMKARINTDFGTARGQVTAAGSCSGGGACGLASVLLPRGIDKMSIWNSGNCAGTHKIIYIVTPAGEVGSARTMNVDGPCSSGKSDQPFPASNPATKLCQNKPTVAGSMAQLITKVNTERAKLDKTGYSMITELTITSAQSSTLETKLGCISLTGASTMALSTLSAKFFFSTVTPASSPSAPSTSQLETQIEADFTTAKNQVTAAGSCGSGPCGLASVLLPRGIDKMSIWNSGECTGPAHRMIYIVTPDTEVGSPGTMNKDGSCSSGFSDQPYPMGTTSTKLCQVKPTTAAPPKGSGTNAPPKGSGTVVLANPLLLLFVFLATVFRG